MKHVGRAVFFACLTALLLLGMRQLVVAPESASAESSPCPARYSGSDDGCFARAGERRGIRIHRTGGAAPPCCLASASPMPVLTRADGCGWLITGRSYVRTVYIAFHLEGSAG